MPRGSRKRVRHGEGRSRRLFHPPSPQPPLTMRLLHLSKRIVCPTISLVGEISTELSISFCSREGCLSVNSAWNAPDRLFAANIIYLDKYMLVKVYKECGIRVRSYCGTKPPRDLEPPRRVRAVRGRDRASAWHAADDRIQAPARAARSRVRRIHRGRTAPPLPEPLQEINAWLAQFRRFWSAHVDALERHLDRMDEPTQPTTQPKKKARRQ